MSTKVLVTGSRDWSDAQAIEDDLRELPAGSTIMHGGAPGADTIAGVIAHRLGFYVRTYNADWKKHGRAAGPLRNQAMIDERPELVLAYWLNRSRGTADTIQRANRAGIEIRVRAVAKQP